MNNVFVSSSNGDPLTSMVMSGDTVQAAAQDPDAIGRLMVDQAYSEGNELEGFSIYYERNTSKKRMLERYETGFEDLLTGGWVRVLTPPRQALEEQKAMQNIISHGDATCHGVYRGVRLIEFHVTKADLTVIRQSKGFG